MTRRLHDLTPDTLDDLPVTCRSCVFWEVAGAPRGVTPRQGGSSPSSGGKSLTDGRGRKEAWWQATQLEWGTPGKAVYDGGRLIGYAAFAPGAHYPTAVRLGGVSVDALLLATLWVDREHRGAGLARLLLQSVLRETHKRGCKALEAFADRRGGNGAGESLCIIGEDFLLANGFSVLREHPSTPLLRLDLRQTVRWQESLSSALEGVASVLGRREGVPAPARTG